jgi:hypothetical protein
MYDIVFAKEKKIFVTTDINDALAEAEANYQIEAEPYALRDLTIDKEGTVNGCKVTEYGFNCLLKVLGIPVSYAKKIPRELLFTNIYSMQRDKAGTEVFVLSRPNEEIASVVKAPYDEITYSDVLAAFSDYPAIKKFTLAEELLVITLSFEELEVRGATGEDIFNVGIFAYNSILKATQLHVESGLYRDICRNSYLLPIMGKVRAEYKEEDHMQRLLRFADNIRCYDTDVVNRLQLRFSSAFNDRSLLDDEVVKYWRSLSRVVGTADADKLVGIDEETRGDLVSTITKRTRRNKRNALLGKEITESMSTDISAYKFMNGITSFAQELKDISAMIATEKIGGQIIQDLVLN